MKKKARVFLCIVSLIICILLSVVSASAQVYYPGISNVSWTSGNGTSGLPFNCTVSQTDDDVVLFYRAWDGWVSFQFRISPTYEVKAGDLLEVTIPVSLAYSFEDGTPNPNHTVFAIVSPELNVRETFSLANNHIDGSYDPADAIYQYVKLSVIVPEDTTIYRFVISPSGTFEDTTLFVKTPIVKIVLGNDTNADAIAGVIGNATVTVTDKIDEQTDQITSAIEDQTNQLLHPDIETPDIENQDDLQNAIDKENQAFDDIENALGGSLDNTASEIENLLDFNFDNNITSGLSMVSSVFSNVLSSFDISVVFSFVLIFALCMYVIGRRTR